MEAYPLRLRRRIVELYEQGLKTKQIAQMLGTCRSGTRRVRQRLRREFGTLEPKPLAGVVGPKGGLTPDVAGRLRAAVAADPGATRVELRDRLAVGIDPRTVGRWLTKLGLTLKKSRSTPPSRRGPTSRRGATSGTRT